MLALTRDLLEQRVRDHAVPTLALRHGLAVCHDVAICAEAAGRKLGISTKRRAGKIGGVDHVWIEMAGGWSIDANALREVRLCRLLRAAARSY